MGVVVCIDMGERVDVSMDVILNSNRPLFYANLTDAWFSLISFSSSFLVKNFAVIFISHLCAAMKERLKTNMGIFRWFFDFYSLVGFLSVSTSSNLRNIIYERSLVLSEKNLGGFRSLKTWLRRSLPEAKLLQIWTEGG